MNPPRISAVAVSVAAVALTASLVSCSGGGDSAADLTFKGAKVNQDSIESTLASAEKALAKTAKDSHGVTADPVRCWAEASPPVEDSQELSGNAFCGPVLFPDSSPSKFWAVYDLGLESTWDEDAEETVAKAGKATLTTASETVAVDPASSYVRTDDAKIPTKSGLEVPPPPPAPADLVGQPADKDPKLEKPAEDRLQGLGTSFVIRGTGTVETVTADRESATTYGPPEGGEIFAVSLSLGDDLSFLRHAAIEVDGKEVRSWDGDDTYHGGDETIAFAVPVDAPVELVLEENKDDSVDPTTDPIVQRYDLRSGKVTDPVEVLYRNREAEPIKSIDIACNWSDLGKRVGYDDEPCVDRFNAEAYLTYSYPLGYGAEIDTDFIVPERDQAVLVVLSNQSTAVLRLADGTVVKPAWREPDLSNQDEWAFVVPADTTKATLITNTTAEQVNVESGYRYGIDHETVISIPT